MNYRICFLVFKSFQEVDRPLIVEGMKWKIGHLGKNAVENVVINESNSIKSCLRKDTKSPTDNPDYVKLSLRNPEIFECLQCTK